MEKVAGVFTNAPPTPPTETPLPTRHQAGPFRTAEWTMALSRTAWLLEEMQSSQLAAHVANLHRWILLNLHELESLPHK